MFSKHLLNVFVSAFFVATAQEVKVDVDTICALNPDFESLAGKIVAAGGVLVDEKNQPALYKALELVGQKANAPMGASWLVAIEDSELPPYTTILLPEGKQQPLFIFTAKQVEGLDETALNLFVATRFMGWRNNCHKRIENRTLLLTGGVGAAILTDIAAQVWRYWGTPKEARTWGFYGKRALEYVAVETGAELLAGMYLAYYRYKLARQAEANARVLIS